mmetsp:Transcript_8573/g.16847  ORF Transcript_8573/g.16847 Transcript_8573/m.16847 type:complete len:294 (-) Transcript_8573:384-1265(-)
MVVSGHNFVCRALGGRHELCLEGLRGSGCLQGLVHRNGIESPRSVCPHHRLLPRHQPALVVDLHGGLPSMGRQGELCPHAVPSRDILLSVLEGHAVNLLLGRLALESLLDHSGFQMVSEVLSLLDHHFVIRLALIARIADVQSGLVTKAHGLVLSLARDGEVGFLHVWCDACDGPHQISSVELSCHPLVGVSEFVRGLLLCQSLLSALAHSGVLQVGHRTLSVVQGVFHHLRLQFVLHGFDASGERLKGVVGVGSRREVVVRTADTEALPHVPNSVPVPSTVGGQSVLESGAH